MNGGWFLCYGLFAMDVINGNAVFHTSPLPIFTGTLLRIEQFVICDENVQ